MEMEVALLTDQDKVEDWPVAIEVGEAVKEFTVGVVGALAVVVKVLSPETARVPEASFDFTR
jgi:hypothetical protein